MRTDGEEEPRNYGYAYELSDFVGLIINGLAILAGLIVGFALFFWAGSEWTGMANQIRVGGGTADAVYLKLWFFAFCGLVLFIVTLVVFYEFSVGETMEGTVTPALILFALGVATAGFVGTSLGVLSQL